MQGWLFGVYFWIRSCWFKCNGKTIFWMKISWEGLDIFFMQNFFWNTVFYHALQFQNFFGLIWRRRSNSTLTKTWWEYLSKLKWKIFWNFCENNWPRKFLKSEKNPRFEDFCSFILYLILLVVELRSSLKAKF